MDYDVSSEDDVRMADSVVVYLSTFLLEDEELDALVELIASVDSRKLTFVRESDPHHGGVSAKKIRSLVPEGLRRALPSAKKQVAMRHEFRLRSVVIEEVLQAMGRGSLAVAEDTPTGAHERSTTEGVPSSDASSPTDSATTFLVTLELLMSM